MNICSSRRCGTMVEQAGTCVCGLASAKPCGCRIPCRCPRSGTVPGDCLVTGTAGPRRLVCIQENDCLSSWPLVQSSSSLPVNLHKHSTAARPPPRDISSP